MVATLFSSSGSKYLMIFYLMGLFLQCQFSQELFENVYLVSIIVEASAELERDEAKRYRALAKKRFGVFSLFPTAQFASSGKTQDSF